METIKALEGERIYISYPITTDGEYNKVSPEQEWQNIQDAMALAARVMAKGHGPYIPSLNWFMNRWAQEHPEIMEIMPRTYEFFLGWDFLQLAGQHAILYTKPSFGCDAELAEAERLGLKIYRSEDEIPEVK